MKKKECPSCAMEINADEKVCPFCNYEFPSEPKTVKYIGYLLLVVIVIFVLLQIL